MLQFHHFGRLLVLLLVLQGLPGWAQTVQEDSQAVHPPVRPPTPVPSETARLKAALGAPIGSVQVADSLLAQARQLGYVPGQVVALSHLAGLQLQQQLPEAGATLKEAEQLAGQLHDLKETGWAMNQVSRIQNRFLRVSPALAEPFGPLSQALATALSTAVPVLKSVEVLKGMDFNPFGPDNAGRGNKHRTRVRVVRPDGEPAGPPGPPNGPAAAYYHPLVELGQIEHWLDTLLTREHNPPQVVRQLAARRKRRDSSQALSQAYAKEGDYAKAYRYFLQYSAYKDSLTAEATTRRLAALEYKQTLLKKEAQIQRLTKQRYIREQAARRQQQFVLALVGCIVLLGGVAVVLVRTNQGRQLANRRLQEQKQTLQQTLAELKNTQAQLIQSEKMASLGELTAGIAHEIQNPLNFVNNFSEVSTELIEELKEQRQHEPRDPELEQELLNDVQQNLEKISEHGVRASAIVRGMLEHARTSSGQKEPVDLNALADEYLKLAYHGTRAKDKGFEARLTTHFDATLGKVLAVPQDLSRVLMNVFSNAFYAVRQKQEAHPPGYQPEISVCTKREANRVKVQIRDNGTGVPSALKQKIFQPFFTTKPTGQGTGLGLSLSYDIITNGHGGTFTLDSEEGQFTELTLTLPAA